MMIVIPPPICLRWWRHSSTAGNQRYFSWEFVGGLWKRRRSLPETVATQLIRSIGIVFFFSIIEGVVVDRGSKLSPLNPSETTIYVAPSPDNPLLLPEKDRRFGNRREDGVGLNR
ncbi:hypothetical protein E3N88_05781 [Mikania micrantha]|uniref:Uncharacterized protein n=1 Tax=Mikania micrantha TaxID=192012 RepID=A0A5N6PNR6_9ASTR|nr:hypothetical protein E3N88_05781 [Mikania micrantha]